MRWSYLVVAVLSLCVTNPAWGRTLYLSPQGSNHARGSQARPWRTLAAAVKRLQAGDTLLLESGTYRGGVVVAARGRPGQWITLAAAPHAHVLIDGRGHEDDLYFYNDGFRPAYCRVRGLDLVGGNNYVVKIDVPEVQLLDNDLHGSHDDILKLVRTAHHILVQDNRIHDNAASDGANAQGVDIVGATDVAVVHNQVYNIPSIGMYAKGNARNVVFAHNVLHHIYDRGIMLGQSTGKQFLRPGQSYESYDSVIRDNLIVNTGSACLATSSSWHPQIYGNVCLDVARRMTSGIFVSNESELHQGGTDVAIHNNIVILGGTRPAVEIAPQAMSDDATLHIDHNLYWSASGARGVRFSWSRGLGEDKPSFYFVSLARWRHLSGQDAHSVIAAPTPALERETLGFRPTRAEMAALR